MNEFYVKECPFDGPQNPVDKSNGVLNFAVPAKCDGCQYYFEASCRKITNRLLRLDYGFCGIEGSKKLVSFEAVSRKIPEKCKSCNFLKTDKLRKLICSKDADIWGDIPRGLDY